MGLSALEQMTVEEAIADQPATAVWIRSILRRIEGVWPIPEGAKVLDIGAAQGRALVVLVEEGYDAYGVEPWDQARETAAVMAEEFGVSFDLRAGAAEEIPFPDAHFDVVLATAVMEHVTDLEQSLAEISRVLKPGGVFWFSSASAMCPIQNEITSFPGFGLYPDFLKKRIMLWAKDEKPELVGHTDAPAMHWFTNRRARQHLDAAGFHQVMTRWELRREEEYSDRLKGVMGLIQGSKTLQRLADIVVPGCSYAAVKRG